MKHAYYVYKIFFLFHELRLQDCYFMTAAGYVHMRPGAAFLCGDEIARVDVYTAVLGTVALPVWSVYCVLYG